MFSSEDCRLSSVISRNSKSLLSAFSTARRLRLQSDGVSDRAQMAQFLPSYHLASKRSMFSGEGSSCAWHSWPQSPFSGQREHDSNLECSCPRNAIQKANLWSTLTSAGRPVSGQVTDWRPRVLK